jgi:2-oxoglutarate ferredoxin oxidoreductase subunit gamma
MAKKIIFAGAGGQGIMLMSKLLAQAALSEGKFISVMPSYGAEMRGGTANCTICISNEPVNSPYVKFADIVVAMNEQSFLKFSKNVKDKGLLIANSTFVKRKIKNKSFKVIYRPFTDLATQDNNVKAANMFALGCFVKITQLVKPASVLIALSELFKEESILNINRLAFNKGAKLVARR